MVLGRKTNPRSATSIQVDYLITIQEIKPWPPSPLLASLRSVIIQWENGESSSGCTRSVVPVPQSSSIEFNESFQLPLTLQKDMSSSKPPENAAFLKNNLILNLYEPPRRDNNITKGKLIATTMIDLADYGVVEEALRIRAAMNCKRSFRNMVQPVLYVDILPYDKVRTCSSSCGSLSKELSLVEADGESIAALMISHEYAEEAFSSSASRKYRGGGFPSRNKQVKITDEVFQQNPTRVDAGDGRNGENGYEEHYLMEEAHSTENGAIEISTEAMQHPGTGTFSFSWGNLAMKDDVLTDNIQEHVESSKSSSSDTAIRIGLHNHVEEKEHERDEDSGGPDDEQVVRQRETRGDTKRHITDRRRAMSDAKVQHLQRRIQMLEGELTEAAAMEVALYSVVAEHGNSASKTHAPARRLSRLYLHALSQSQQASAARSALSGLVLVVKACGNDVPRLTFWLSNSIMLRAILSQAIVKKKISQQSFLSKKSDRNIRVGDHDKDEELENFIADVEKIEAWIFSRTVESIWWQILTPHMQSTAARRINRDKRHGSDSRRLALAHAEEQAQADISLGIWKAAFKDACERLCPVRARGQKCGCLSLPGQLIMEQCVARLDVAMFNALLRESDDDIPTDPVSDPISDPKVLPIPAGKKLSFRAGAQLKNVIGNWSRWLTDLLGMYNIESDEDDPKSETKDTPFRSFRLLYALSDLMMLPKDLLLNRTTRKEVCPTFGALLILRVLENFIPDEFCPDPVPEEVLEALIHEDPCECGAEELLNMYPCTAAPPIYSPPSAASISAKSQQKSDGSLMKSQNSDDELDQVSSPLASISLHPSSSSPDSTLASSLWKETVNRNVCRYQLLRDIWMNE